MNNFKPILYAEDDDNDVYLMHRACNKLHIPNPLRIVEDGKLTVAYLAGTAPYENREQNPLPCLLLMDLSMPRKHGLEVLKWLRQESRISTLPVVIFTSSNQESDIHRAYDLGADGFIVKPGDSSHLLTIMKSIQDYWLADSRPPMDFVDFATTIVIKRPRLPQLA